NPLCKITTPKISRPVSIICSLLPATTAVTIAVIAITETSGIAGITFSVVLRKINITIKQRTIVMSTTLKTVKNISNAETSSHSRANKYIIAGVKNGDDKVETVVIATDKATFPLAKNVMTFEAVPPGQQPTRMTPSAISGGNASSFANANAKSGIME